MPLRQCYHIWLIQHCRYVNIIHLQHELINFIFSLLIHILARLSYIQPCFAIYCTDEEELHSPKPFEVQALDYQIPSVEENIMSANAITYVAGYLLRKCLQQHPCKVCSKDLIQSELDDFDQTFCHYKAYDEVKGPFGSLIVPVPSFVEYITKCENIFIQEFTNSTTKATGIGKSIVTALLKFRHGSCEEFPVSFLCKLFVRMRIYYAVKFANREITNTKGSKRNKKYLRVAHL